jgi:hypothetical protein
VGKKSFSKSKSSSSASHPSMSSFSVAVTQGTGNLYSHEMLTCM